VPVTSPHGGSPPPVQRFSFLSPTFLIDELSTALPVFDSQDLPFTYPLYVLPRLGCIFRQLQDIFRHLEMVQLGMCEVMSETQLRKPNHPLLLKGEDIRMRPAQAPTRKLPGSVAAFLFFPCVKSPKRCPFLLSMNLAGTGLI